MKKTVLKIEEMDCPSEENLIRLKLKRNKNIRQLNFNLQARELEIIHSDETSLIVSAIDELQLNARLQREELINGDLILSDNKNEQKKLLIAVLVINAAFFLIEGAAGIFYNSMGLSADALDMLADAFVYSLSLFAIYKSVGAQKKIAKVSGYFQAALAVFGIVETTRRVFGFEGMPNYSSMIAVSLFALAGNAASLIILNKSKSSQAHIKASVICTSNDVIANMGVIIAGIFVFLTSSKFPDLIAGIIIFAIVINGSRKILALAK